MIPPRPALSEIQNGAGEQKAYAGRRYFSTSGMEVLHSTAITNVAACRLSSVRTILSSSNR